VAKAPAKGVCVWTRGCDGVWDRGEDGTGQDGTGHEKSAPV